MPRKKKETEPILEPEIVKVEQPAKKVRAPRKKKAPVPRGCWDFCKSEIDPGYPDDFVHICLGDVFVTRCQIERMMTHKSEEESK